MVLGMAQVDPSHQGMATTLSGLLVAGGKAFIAQVGDSRVYLNRDGVVVQVTEAHTLVNLTVKQGLMTAEQAKTAKGKNIITRAVGMNDHVELDCIDMAVKPGDRFLLCSDGLTDYLRGDELGSLMMGESSRVAQALIDLANDRGGKDNITVVIVEVVD